MLNKDKTGLIIFESGKFKSMEFYSKEDASLETSSIIFVNSMEEPSLTIGENKITFGKRASFFERLLKLKQKFFSVSKFFDDIKRGNKVLIKDILEKELINLSLIKENAQINNQIALLEKLEEEKERIERELILSKLNYYYIEEKDVVKFAKNSDKFIKLDWINNFTRIIPEKVTFRIAEALRIKIEKEKETVRLFDNVVIMHYDPRNSGSEKTKKEKDPIAFGVIKGSNRLYFIADWIDEYCDLTLDKLLKKIELKKSDRKLDFESIKNRISREDDRNN